GLPYEVLLHPASSPPYMVSVRPFRYRSLAYFSSSVTADNLASYLASGHDPSASGTFTLWNTQIHGLYSPCKAHTNTKMNMRTELLLIAMLAGSIGAYNNRSAYSF
ncbi:MAG: hypothetical protein AAGI25_12565, partial [Bacteroidota bacterium]